MSYMFEVYYRPPADAATEATIADRIAEFGGRLDFREEPDGSAVCLTYEFGDRNRAQAAAAALRRSGMHVEGPGEYGEPHPSTPDPRPDVERPRH